MKAIVSSCLPENYKKALEKQIKGIEWISLQKNPLVYPSIASHPDIFFCQIGTSLIYSPGINEKILKLIKTKKIKGKTIPHNRYPHTAPYNAVQVGRFIIHNTKITDKRILQEAEKEKLTFINVKQGYSRCSVVTVGSSAIITADKGIEKKAVHFGIDVLLIQKGEVLLPNENYGFLGGSAGILPDKRIVFAGDISFHPNYLDITGFFEKHKIAYIHTTGLKLLDIGTIIFIK